MFRLTIGKKLNTLVIALQVLSIAGVVALATRLFTSDLEGLLRKGSLDASAMLSGRVRAEMKGIADRARTMGSASLQEFQFPEDRIQFLQDTLAVDPHTLALTLLREDPRVAGKFQTQWRIVQPELQKRHALQSVDFDRLDTAHPLRISESAKGSVDFTVGELKTGLSVLRMAIPFVQKSDGSFSQILVAELHQESLASVFGEATAFTSYLVDRDGRVLGSTNVSRIPLGTDLQTNPVVQAERRGTTPSGQLDYVDAQNETQMAAYQQVGFAGLTVISEAPLSTAQAAQQQLLRRTGLLGGAFLCLALALGFLFSQSITNPIRALAAAAQKVQSGDFSVRLKHRKLKDGTPTGDEIQRFSAMFNEMVAGLEERDRVKATFAKFHSQEMVEKVLSGELKLGGEKRNAAVFFSDVRGFTAMSEKVEPEVLVSILNRYMTRMVRIILANGGIVDKFVGDAIMAVWGAPVSRENDVRNAVMACLQMRQSVAELNEQLISEGVPPIKIGMGLNYGPLVAGNIGSEERMEYTVIGDTVNTASRIESLTKEFGTDLLVSQAVLDQVPGIFEAEKTHEAKVKGKSEPLVIYKVHGYQDQATGQIIRIQTAYSSYAAERSDKVVHDTPAPSSVPESTATVTLPPPFRHGDGSSRTRTSATPPAFPPSPPPRPSAASPSRASKPKLVDSSVDWDFKKKAG